MMGRVQYLQQTTTMGLMHLTGLFHEKVTIVTCIYTALKVKGKRAPTRLQRCVASAVRPISLVHLCEALLAQKEARCAHVHRKSKVDVS